MGTKTIRVREDVYERLQAQKRPDESFSDLLGRLADRKTAFERGFGTFEGLDLERGLEALDERFEASFGPRQ